MRISVLVPTFRRPTDLERCIASLAAQARLPDEVIIITRDVDADARLVLTRWTHARWLSSIVVDVPGVIQALNRGLAHSTGEIIAITDDDAAPHADWLARMERHFEQDLRLGGLGGRDIIHEKTGPIPARTKDVGRIHAFGRISGNHHIGRGPARQVDHLKGVNMSWRRAALDQDGFDTALRGAGAQVYFEFATSLVVIGRHWRIKFDPELLVDHFPAPRFDQDQRDQINLEAIENASFNLSWSLLHHMQRGPRRQAALVWERLIGASNRPGAIRLLAAQLKGDVQIQAVAKAAARGREQAAVLHNSTRSVGHKANTFK